MSSKVQIALGFALIGGVFGCAAPDRLPSEPAPDKPKSASSNVLAPTNSPATCAPANRALGQLDRARVVLRIRHPVTSVSQAVPEIQKTSVLRILAMAERDDWFWYATGVARDSDGKAIVQFLSGYAVKRGDRQVRYWSVW